MGSVWLAEHLTLHTKVVVKFMSTALASHDALVARFSREAAAAAAVKSPHVVHMLDHGVAADGAPFIVMELLEGEDMRRRLDREPPLAAADIDAIVSQVCKALGRAHAAGVVHRDIKPDNIFLCQGEEGIYVKLLDFGIAKQGDAVIGMAKTKTGATLGTPYYMSPEQTIGAKDVDLRTDLWSLGVVAYEALTGKRPFDGETVGALAVAITHGPIPVPSAANPSLGPAVDAWFGRACAREVAARFASAKEMADAFHEAISRPGVRAMRTSTGVSSLAPTTPAPALGTTTSPTSDEAQKLPVSRGVGMWVAGVVVGLGIVVAAVLYVTHQRQSTPSTPPTASTESPVASITPLEQPQRIEPLELKPATTPGAVANDPHRPAAEHVEAGKPGAHPTASGHVAPVPSKNCIPPYTIDSTGKRVPKPECL
jgi:serine/threonine-protein kinase